MHANHSFRIQVTLEGAIEGDIKEAVLDEYQRWLDSYGDENNWDCPHTIITKTGRVIALLEDNDSRGREHFANDLREKVDAGKVKDPYAWATRFALDCVVNDMQVFDLPVINLPGIARNNELEEFLDKMSFHELIAHVHETATKKLAALYSELSTKRYDPKETWSLEGYKRSKLAQMYEALISADTPPFATGFNPYEYRAHELSYGYEGDDLAILISDIHT